MKDELIVISKKDLDACESDMHAYLGLSVLLFNRLFRADASFKESYEYDKAREVLRFNETSL